MAKRKQKNQEKDDCFVIMPFSDPEGYEKGHFDYVYEHLFQPAIKSAGFNPKRADSDKDASIIHIGMVRDLIEKPMAVVDISATNPNVMFEFGFRQAFDMPTVVVAENDTRRVFDTDMIRRIHYDRNCKYDKVLDFRDRLEKAILATKKAEKDGTGINSLVRLVELSKATVKEGAQLDAQEVLVAISNLRTEVGRLERKEPADYVPKSVANLMASFRSAKILRKADFNAARQHVNKFPYSAYWKDQIRIMETMYSERLNDVELDEFGFVDRIE